MSIKDNYYIKQIDYKTAMNVIVNCHYSHRKAPCTYAFGLYSIKPHKLVGVITYGSPASHFLCDSLCGYDERYNIYELTRLYVDDGLPKNLESFFISHTLKLLDKEIIVSYSDTEFNHIGVVYQATNFYYTGLSADVVGSDYEELLPDGHKLHPKAVMVKYGSVENIQKAISLGANIYKVERSRKHRYVYFNCSKHRKKELLSKLNFEILPYPKQDNSVPKTSDKNISDIRKRGLF